MSEEVSRSQTSMQQFIPRAYHESLVTPLFARWASQLVDFVGVPAGATILDVASGTGVVAHLAAERVGKSGQVTASDISPAMLAVAQEGRSDDHVRYVVCAADALAVPTASQDIVLCQQGLQLFPDKVAALREMRRVLRPGGIIGIEAWAAEEPLGLFGPMIETVASFSSEPSSLATIVRGYAMVADEIEGALREAGFQEIQIELRSVVATWDTPAAAAAAIWGTPYGPRLAGLPTEQQDNILRTLARALGGSSEGGSVSCVTFAHLARAVA
jgi:ubiquinone/menaquinone biosynthesis C-methylase UbiE